MIRKFPKLDQLDKDRLIEWLTTQKEMALSDHHKYKSCHNDTMALQCNSRANTYGYIIMMMEYHEEI